MAIQKEQVSAQYSELYELKPNHFRFNEFVGKFVGGFSEADRIKLVTLLISKFVSLHETKVAHRDLGGHSIWLSPSKDVAISSLFQPITSHKVRLGISGIFCRIRAAPLMACRSITRQPLIR